MINGALFKNYFLALPFVFDFPATLKYLNSLHYCMPIPFFQKPVLLKNTITQLFMLSLLITIKINVDRQAAFLCSHVQEEGLDMSSCPAHKNTLSWVIVLSFAVSVLLALGGIWIVVASRPKPSKREFKPIQTSSLSDEERQIYDILKTNDGALL